MLVCLPASGDLTLRLLSRTQMNTGLQKWETTQKMRSANYPTPAELDAYAKKVANHPLTIQIFPNSVKVPQRKHIRRTVNGLDTSSSGQRHSPYPSQVSASRGLLAVLRAPAKGVLKDSDGGRVRQLHKAAMNPHGGPYAAPSTLNLSQPVSHLQGPAQKQSMVHQQVLQQQQQQQQSMTHAMTLQQPQTMPLPQALQQRSLAHSQALHRQQNLNQVQTQQQQQQQQRLAHPPQAALRQQSLPHAQQQQQQQQSQSCPSVVPQQQQHLPHLQTIKHQAPPQAPAPPAPPAPALLTQQQGMTPDLRHLSDGAPLPGLQHSQGHVGSQPLPQAAAAGAAALQQQQQQQQQPPLGAYGPRKLPDADAPPNVTVSTSTIPLSMAASLHQNRPGDLSSIVHQINQLCQARAGMGSTSVCEGQIANPSPISRNLLINAHSRVSSHHPAMGAVPGCLMVAPPDKAGAAGAQAPGAAPPLHSQPNMAATNNLANFHSDPEKVQLQLQQQQQQLQHHLHQQKQQQQQQQHHLQQQQRSWAQHQLAHMQQPPEGAHPCKNPRMEPPAECSYPARSLNYPHKLPNTAQTFPLKHPPEKPRPPSPLNCPVGSLPYMNSHYMQPPWGGVPATPGSNGSGPQDLPASYQVGPAAASADRIPGAKYRPGKEVPGGGGPSKMMQNVDFLGGDFQIPGFQEQNLDAMEKLHRSAMGHVQEPSNGGAVHSHHPGYR